MPLTDNGFEMPDYDDILASIKIRIKQELGSETDVSDGSPMGMLARAWADDQQENYQYMQEIYDNNFVNSASGVSLDRLGRIVNVQRKTAQYAQADLKIVGQAGYLIEAGTEFITDNGDNFLSDEDVQIGNDGNATVSVHSDEAAGYTNVEANTIINQVYPVDEIEEVTNPLNAHGGEDLESDYDLRNRISANTKSSEGPTALGIKTAMLNIANVKGATVQVNNSQTTDKYGNPPNTVHVFVSGGDKQDIAEKLADTIAGGATTVGNEKYEIDIYDNPVQVNFDLAQNVTIYFKIKIDADSNFQTEAIQQAIQDFINDFEMGDNIILNKLFSYLYELNGINSVNEILAGRSHDDLNSQNIQLANYEIPTSSDEAIEVIIDG